MIFGNYNTKKFHFEQLMQDILESDHLDLCHLDYKQEEILGQGKDQSTEIHRKFYGF